MQIQHLQKDNPYFLILFLVCLTIHLSFSFIGWNNTLCDEHGFRQTQTAISTYYAIKDGFKINYITPVLGKPWSIPMEFPLYQWIVAIVVSITKIPLDQCGRLVTLFFFYLSLVPTYLLLNFFISRKPLILIFLCLFLASPFYIFWSRTFMIESLALFLSIAYFVSVIKAIQRPSKFLLLITCIAGTLAGLTKITTFTIFCLFAFFFFIHFLIRHYRYHGPSLKALLKQILVGCIIFGTPFIISIAWVIFADKQKSLNPMANGWITSDALRNWNFGTFFQRISIDTWLSFLRHSSNFFGFSILGFPAVYSLCFFLSRRYRKESFFCIVIFLSGLMIFTNLYYVHEYYFYANGIFLLSSFGFLIAALLEDKKRRGLIKFLIFPAILFLMFNGYIRRYYLVQKNNNLIFHPLANNIKAFTKENDVILIYGFDWSSELPYYSQRRALMDRRELTFTDYKFQSALNKLNKDRIGAMVVGGKRRNDAAFIKERIEKLKLSPKPIFRDYLADLYIAEDNLVK